MTYPTPVLIPRAEFLGFDPDLPGRFDYQRGHHVTVLGPTGSGKTQLAQQLIQSVARPSLPAVILVSKPRDKTVTDWASAAGMKRVQSWPPLARPFRAAPPGWVVWPKFTFDEERDDATQKNLFQGVIRDSFRRGDRMLFADETATLTVDLGLGRTLESVWRGGRSMGCGLWAASQRPAFIPRLAYSMAEHLFLADDPDEQTRKRYSEIGGIDPKAVAAVLRDLDQYHFLYFRRTGRRWCIVGP